MPAVGVELKMVMHYEEKKQPDGTVNYSAEGAEGLGSAA